MPIEDRTQSLSEAFAGGIKRADALGETIQNSENKRAEKEWMNEIRSMDHSDTSQEGQQKSLTAIIQSGIRRGIDPKKIQPYDKMRRMSQQTKVVMEKTGLKDALKSFLVGNLQPLESVMGRMGTHVRPGTLEGSIENGLSYVDESDGKKRTIGRRLLAAMFRAGGVPIHEDKQFAPREMNEYQKKNFSLREKELLYKRYLNEAPKDIYGENYTMSFEEWKRQKGFGGNSSQEKGTPATSTAPAATAPAPSPNAKAPAVKQPKKAQIKKPSKPLYFFKPSKSNISAILARHKNKFTPEEIAGEIIKKLKKIGKKLNEEQVLQTVNSIIEKSTDTSAYYDQSEEYQD